MRSASGTRQQPVSRRVRAYFAAVERASDKPEIFDPAKQGAFPLDAPPSPWMELGEIANFKRSSGTQVGEMRAGVRGAVAGQYRANLDAKVECDFLEWGKLQMALAGGSQHMNVLAEDANAEARPTGGRPLAAVAVLAGSSAGELVVGSDAAAKFAAGDWLAVDADYQQQTGYVGTGIAGAYVKDPADVSRDINYVRRVTFNVARVAQMTASSLLLEHALRCGVPEGAAIQKVVAFTDREGGSFFQEWSALFVMEEESGGRVCFHYPRLMAAAAADRERAMTIATPISAVALHGVFTALPYVDENDGEPVLCYRNFFPFV